MQTTLRSNFTYNGLTIQSRRLPKPRKVDILGVTVPCDPGFVTIKDGDKIRDVPTFVLDACPKIDWDALMSKEQKQEREYVGVLFGSGQSDRRKRRLVPLAKCLKATK